MLVLEPFAAFYHGALKAARSELKRDIRPLEPERAILRMGHAAGYPTFSFSFVDTPADEWMVVPTPSPEGLTISVVHGRTAHVLRSGPNLLKSFDALFDRHWSRADLYHAIMEQPRPGALSYALPAYSVAAMAMHRRPPESGEEMLYMHAATRPPVAWRVRYLSHTFGYVNGARVLRAALDFGGSRTYEYARLPHLGHLLRRVNAQSWTAQPRKQAPAWKAGDRVLVDYNDGNGHYWLAKITNVRPNGRCDVVYDSDGSEEANVALRRIAAYTGVEEHG